MKVCKTDVKAAMLPKEQIIRGLLDSLCRDGTDVQYMQYLKEKPYNFTTNTLKAYLSA